jgi:hypothetical protein
MNEERSLAHLRKKAEAKDRLFLLKTISHKGKAGKDA